MAGYLNLSRKAWWKAARFTLLVTVFTNIVAVAGSVYSGMIINGAFAMSDALVAAILATVLTAPILAVLSVKIQQLHAANHKLERYATTDDMTGVLNRRAFTSRLERFLARDAKPACLLVVDVDKFKQVNDLFGHDQGDKALTAIAAAMADTLRPGDLIGRLGGEEFGVFLPECTARDGLLVGERVRKSVLAISFMPDGKNYPLSVSIGLSCCLEDRTFENMYKNADILLYAAKNNGRNRVEHEPKTISANEKAMA